MQVTVESVSNLERKLTVEIPAAEIDGEVESRLNSMRPKIKLDGFRPGKTPISEVRKRYGKDVHQEVIGEVMQRTFFEAVQEKELRPAGMPAIDPGTPVMGQNLEYVATFEVYPEVTLGDISTLKFEVPVTEITDDDVDRMLENLREQKMDWQPVERAAADGDMVVIDIVGKVDGEVFEGGTAEGLEATLGSGGMIPGFEEQLVGIAKDEERLLNVTFPEDYQAEELKGKDATFDAKCTEVKESVKPEIDAEFAKGLGIEDGSTDSLREDVKSNLERQIEATVKAKVKEQCVEQLSSMHEIELPKALVDQEIEMEKQQAMKNMQGLPADSLPADLFEESARRRVTLGLVMGEIISEQKLVVESEKVDAYLTEMAAGYGDSSSFIEYYKEDPQRLAQIESVVMEEQVIDWVVSQAQSTEKTMSFSELTKPATEEADE